MLNISLADKIGTLINIITSSPIFIIITIISILLNIALYKNKDNKNVKNVFIIFHIILFIGLFISYGKAFTAMLDYLVENIIKLIYFPNLAAYILMIIISNIIMITTLISGKNNKIKLINTTIYSIQVLLFLITIFIVTKEKVNVYEMFSVYTNKDLLVLIELSSFISVVWIIAVILSKLIDYITVNISVKEEIKVMPYKPIFSLPKEKIKVDNIPEEKTKSYNGPLIDTPIYANENNLNISIFKRINNGIDHFIDRLVDGKPKEVKEEVTVVNANNTYIEKVLLEEERPNPTKYITIEEKPKIEEHSKEEFQLDQDITLEKCYELRKAILAMQDNRQKAH